MDVFWVWFYDQLERKPGEGEEEILKRALEETVEAPSGVEPLLSAGLLQSRIGNQAMRQLVKMKTVRRHAQEEQRQEGLEEEGEAVRMGIRQAATEPALLPEEAPRTLSEVLQEEGSGRLKQPLPGKSQIREGIGRRVERKPGSTEEEKLAAAMAVFLPTLNQGGRSREWNTLTTLFGEASLPAREDVLRILHRRFSSLGPSVKKVFLQRLMHWRRLSNDELAALLWLRLAPSAGVDGGKVEGGGDGSDDD